MATYDALKDVIIRGDAEAVKVQTNKALEEGCEPRDILRNGLIGGMSVVGERFAAGDMFLPEVIMCADAMHKGLDIVKPLLAQLRQQALRRVVIGTVEGDIHDIGKRIVGFLLEGSGLEVIDLGVDVKVEKFAEAIREHNPDILGLSALLTTTMPNMEKTIEFLKSNGLRDQVRIIVGGAPVNEEFAKAIGADGYAPEAGSAVELVRRLLAG